MSKLDELKSLLQECLESRIPKELAERIRAALERAPGRPGKIDDAQVAALYAQLKSQQAVADQLGVTQVAVSHSLKRSGAPTLGRGRPKKS